MKVRFQADANLDPDIGLGLQRRDASIDYRLALGVIPDGMVDPDVLAVAAEGGRVLVTNDLRMHQTFFRIYRSSGLSGSSSRPSAHVDRRDD